ncbi:hypothetical protein GCK72_011824 [Caenorhabditis remanei]|uniref:Uncharacterized protein n=2 Tax=Caenorhabditis remanei TaxID=31234 RepID=A0A6A5H748_CAERE|nr:hypothetical protein GCK72_011824 [Caenorhabditis remanei]KAF1763558.1 hypothetical protein GCK72_011824 [Caenorhabditis remanei]
MRTSEWSKSRRQARREDVLRRVVPLAVQDHLLREAAHQAPALQARPRHHAHVLALHVVVKMVGFAAGVLDLQSAVDEWYNVKADRKIMALFLLFTWQVFR